MRFCEDAKAKKRSGLTAAIRFVVAGGRACGIGIGIGIDIGIGVAIGIAIAIGIVGFIRDSRSGQSSRALVLALKLIPRRRRVVDLKPALESDCDSDPDTDADACPYVVGAQEAQRRSARPVESTPVPQVSSLESRVFLPAPPG
jgi:hypothetical protein